MFVVGLTGGIGSGKTTVSDQFARLGIGIVDADIIAKDIVSPGKPALKKIVVHFGADILGTQGSLNRQKLRELVFTNSEARAALEHITHPEIRREIFEQIAVSTSPYTILSAPLLLETGLNNAVDKVLVVDLSENAQVQRSTSRDKVSEATIRNIIAAQIAREQRLKLADDIIDNSGSIENTKQQVKKLHGKYLDML